MTAERAIHLLEDAIAAGATPGAVVVVGRSDGMVVERALGRLTYEPGAPVVDVDTIYDLASLTKVIVTTSLAMLLHERSQLDLDAPVGTYLPEFSGEDKDRVSVADLLAHCGGLLWWTDLYRQFPGRSPAQSKQAYVEAICELPLDYAPRTKTVYSDLGFLLLGEILERLTGAPLDSLGISEIFEPLGLTGVQYNPSESLRSRIAPTEEDEWRGTLLQGVVHDENAYGLGGVAPHAGLFSPAHGIVPFARMLLSGGVSDTGRFCKAETIEYFTTRAGLAPDSSRALGWDTPAPRSSCGTSFSGRSFGHTGFTGTSLWIDPERDLFSILLTNRVHPSRENPKLAALRPAFHDALAEVLDQP